MDGDIVQRIKRPRRLADMMRRGTNGGPDHGKESEEGEESPEEKEGDENEKKGDIGERRWRRT